jgi:hypothetical protein
MEKDGVLINGCGWIGCSSLLDADTIYCYRCAVFEVIKQIRAEGRRRLCSKQYPSGNRCLLVHLSGEAVIVLSVVSSS